MKINFLNSPLYDKSNISFLIIFNVSLYLYLVCVISICDTHGKHMGIKFQLCKMNEF